MTNAVLKVFSSGPRWLELLSCFMPLSVWQMEVEWALLQSLLKLSWSHLFKSFHFRHSHQTEVFWETVLIWRGYVSLLLIGIKIERTCCYSCDIKQREGRVDLKRECLIETLVFWFSCLSEHNKTLNASQLWFARFKCSIRSAEVGARYKLVYWLISRVVCWDPTQLVAQGQRASCEFPFGEMT